MSTGEKRSGKFMVQSMVPAKTGRGKEYMRLKLLEPGGKQWNGVCWEEPKSWAVGGVIVDCFVEESEYNGEAQLTVLAMRELPKEEADIFLPRTPHSVQGMMTELVSYAETMTDKPYAQLALQALGIKDFSRSPAATQFHHAYLGGLLEHTLNLVRLVKVMCNLYPRLRHDLLLTGAILHDIGKVLELNNGVTIEYSDEGLLQGHIVLGLLMVNRWMDKIEGFDEMRRRLVNHLIISHHGNKNYGSPKEPLLLEAQVLSDLDGLDAHIGSISAVLDRTPADRQWSEKIKFETRYYLGDVKP